MTTKKLQLRRPDRCIRCDAELLAGTLARWDPSNRTVTCLPCTELAAAADSVVVPNVDSGVAGASIGREHARRRSKRERRVRDAHPRIGGVLLALSTPPQHEEAFRIGEEGEIAVATVLKKAVAQVDGIVLHNRRRPGGRGDIDHIAIVSSGVYVIDAKAVKGKVEIRRPWFEPPLLLVAGRDCTEYLTGLDRQTQAVRDAITTAGDDSAAPVQGALCFTRAGLPRRRTIEIRGHLLVSRRALTTRLLASGPLDAPRIRRFAAVIDRALTPA